MRKKNSHAWAPLMAKMFQNLQNQDQQPSAVKVEVLKASTLYERKKFKIHNKICAV
jgi:hypothetical protein